MIRRPLNIHTHSVDLKPLVPAGSDADMGLFYDHLRQCYIAIAKKMVLASHATSLAIYHVMDLTAAGHNPELVSVAWHRISASMCRLFISLWAYWLGP